MIPAPFIRCGVMIITVSGAQSGVGKTKMVESLLGKLDGWAAVKVTVIKDTPCPRKKPCGTCDELSVPFEIISYSKVINQKGKDTQRMKAAGAKRVLWLKAREKSLKRGIESVLKRLKKAKGIVIEGTSALKYLNPDLSIHIDKKGKAKLLKWPHGR